MSRPVPGRVAAPAPADPPEQGEAPLPPRPGTAPVPTSLLDTLMANPARFSFDAAVAVMMRASGRGDPGVAIRFEAAIGLAYVPGDVTSVRPERNGPFVARTGILGLTGPGGALPRPYTEMANSQARQRSAAFSRFLDLVAQRPLAQFAQAGLKYRPHRAADAAAADRESPDDPAAAPRDGLREALLALAGYADPGLVARLASGSEPVLYYSGLFAARPRSAGRLSAILTEWLGRPVVAEQFVGAWVEIGREQMTMLPRAGLGQFNRLGVDATAGARAWDIGSRILLRVGPLDEAQFRQLLPGSALLTPLRALVRSYLGAEAAVIVNPVLAAAAVPPPALTAAARCLLGWTTWLPVGGGRTSSAAEARFRL